MADARRYKGRKQRKSESGPPAVIPPEVLEPEPVATSREVTAVQEAKARAIAEYRACGIVRQACKAADVGRTTWTTWVESDPTFAADVQAARVDAIEALEFEAHTRALGGSDRMLELLLKALAPLKYRDRPEVGRVSPDVQERLKRQVQLIVERLPAEQVTTVKAILDEVWK